MDNSRENGIGKQEWTILEQTEETNKNGQFQSKGRDKQEWTILEKTEETNKNGQFYRIRNRQTRMDNPETQMFGTIHRTKTKQKHKTIKMINTGSTKIQGVNPSAG